MFVPLKEAFHLDALSTAPARFRLLHVFSAVAVLLLIVEVASGVLLLAYYRPTVSQAFSSIGVITDEVWLGWLIRSLHAWCADFLILFSLLHLARVFFARAYQAPRQLTWMTGVVLLCVLLAFGFTGTLLPWDQYAYWSTEAARHAIAAIPWFGTIMLDVFWGGWEIGEEVLLRFYVLHIGILPWIAGVLLWLHLLLVWRFGLTEPVLKTRRYGRAPSPFFPDFAMNLLIAVLLLFGLLISIATLFPPPVANPADPLTPLVAVRPRWYFVAAYEALRTLSGEVMTMVVVATLLILLLIPIVDGQPAAPRWRAIVRWTLGGLALATWLYLEALGYLV